MIEDGEILDEGLASLLRAGEVSSLRELNLKMPGTPSK